jgi:aromatic ring-opening dioxygenase LigB subunit
LKDDGPYGFVPEGPVFDKMVCDSFANNDLGSMFDYDEKLCETAAECGLRSFEIMAGALDGLEHTGELLSYEGPFGVGYGVAAFEVATTQDTVKEVRS